MPDFNDKVDLAQQRLGGSVLYATDDFFASKDNLLKPDKPIFIEGKYTDRGKWMDGWESRRRRVPGHDFCLVRLGVPGIVRGVVVDTSFFKGNYPEHCSIDACSAHANVTPDELLSESALWTEILPKTALVGDTVNAFAIAAPHRFTHLRLHIYPDGGVARLRVHGDVLPDPRWMGRSGSEVDLAAVENGAVVVTCNDMFFGSRHNLIMPGRSVNMGDGWETKRSRRAGPDWVVVKLASLGTIDRIEVDTNHFKGNYPESCRIFVCHAPHATAQELATEDVGWAVVLERTKLQPHTRHFYEHELARHAPATHARLEIFPDGGVSRLRLWGTVSRDGREEIGMRWLDTLPEDDAVRELLACCGSPAWARGVAKRRPFGALQSAIATSDDVWRALSHEDWLEAFRAHPRIGERKAQVESAEHAAHSADAKRWAEHEQSKVAHAQSPTLEALANANREYEAKFGHIFLVCATGKSAEEILATLRARMTNDAATELHVAAEEQRKITHLRLERLVMR